MRLLHLVLSITLLLNANMIMAGTSKSAVASLDAETAETQQQNVAAVKAFLQFLEVKDMESWFALWHDEGVQDLPYSPEQFPKKFDGIEALRNHWHQVPDLFETISFSNVEIYPMQDPNVVYAEFDGSLLSNATGRHYNNDYAGLFKFQDGKIILYREYYNPLVLIRDFGIEAVDQGEE